MGSWDEGPALRPQHNALGPQAGLGRSRPLSFRDAQSFGAKPNGHHMALPVVAGDLQQDTVTTTKCFPRRFHDVTYQMYVIFQLFTLDISVIYFVWI